MFCPRLFVPLQRMKRRSPLLTIINQRRREFPLWGILCVCFTFLCPTVYAQRTLTPAPDGKKPFYVNHYGCPTAHYLANPKDYEEPYAILLKADSLGKLTKHGRDVMRRLNLLCQDAKGREGEMMAEGGHLVRTQVQQMIRRCPEMLTNDCYIDIRSIMQNHCIQMADEAGVEMARHYRWNRISVKSSHKNMNWMDPQDKELLAERKDSVTMARYNRFVTLNTSDTRLMKYLFNDQNYVVANIDATTLSRQLYALSENIKHTALAGHTTLDDLFTSEEKHRHWRKQNAWNYICYGNCALNGGHQAYMQREPLWNMLHMGDSIIKVDFPVYNLRYTTRGVLLSLASLMELDDCGVTTDNLDKLETLGWVDDHIAPSGGHIIMILYRRDKNDDDPLVKVIFNGHEARLPFNSDYVPYYHWKDVKRYYLRKLYRYEKARQDALDNNNND